MTCDTGYVVINDTGTDYDEVDVYDTLIVCGEAGYWTNNGELPGCQGQKNLNPKFSLRLYSFAKYLMFPSSIV
jgi:hypothetical protein